MTRRQFSLDEARRLVADEIVPVADELVALRADLTAALSERSRGEATVAIADIKAMEARLAEMLDGFAAEGIEVKGWAPLLLDFPAEHEGEPILFCWLEGDRSLEWFHHADHGFAGRRPITDLD